MLVIAVIIFMLIYLSKILYEHCRVLYFISKFDGPKCNSFLWGNLDILTGSTGELYQRAILRAKEFYPHYKLRVLSFTTIGLLQPEDIELFLEGRKHSSKCPKTYTGMVNWLGDGLLISRGEKWLKRRKILTPAFHFRILADFLHVLNDQTEHFLEILSENTSRPIDVVPLCIDLTLRSINETAMGKTLDMNNSHYEEYRNAIHEIEEIILYRMMRPWLLPSLIYSLTPTSRREKLLLRVLHGFTRKIVSEKMSTFKGIPNLGTFEENGIYMNQRRKRLAFLDILLQANLDGNQIDYDGICEEVDTFMFEGHDTTSSALSFSMMLIANHPDIQDEIFQEIKSVCQGDQKPTYAELQKLELLERVIKETLRLYPSVVMIARKIDEDTKLHSGLIIPKNSSIHFEITSIHRNPDIFPHPEQFNPDRFLPENCQNRHPYAYIPFSAGPRNCIGQKFAILELKSALTGCLKKFRMIAVDTPDTIIMESGLVLRSKHGIKIRFEPRSP